MTYNTENYGFGLQEVAPYAHPQHWNGHTFGQGELTAPQLIENMPRAAADFSQQVLTSFFNHPGLRHTLETFQAGQTFSAASYPEGTILAFRQERLYTGKLPKATRLLDGVDCEPPAASQGLPAFTKDFRPYCLTLQDEQKSLRDSTINYWNKAIWGVITADKKGDPLIVCTPPALVDCLPNNVTVGSSTLQLRPVVQMGEVRHTRSGNYERLSRVLLLEVCAFGQAEAEPQ